MKLKTKKFQDGGTVSPSDASQQGAAAQQAPDQGGTQQGADQDPLMQMAELAASAIQNQDCQSALQVCQAFVQLIQQQQGQQGGGSQPAPQGEPVYKAGGKLVRRINK